MVKQKEESAEMRRELQRARFEMSRMKNEAKTEVAQAQNEKSSVEKEKDLDVARLRRENQGLKEQLKKNEVASKADLVRLNRQADQILTGKQKIEQITSEMKVSSTSKCTYV